MASRLTELQRALADPEGARIFKESAKALWGAHWIINAAEAFDIQERNLRRMAEGHTPIPVGIWKDMDRLLLEEANRLLQLAASAPKVPE